jgi:creatinine amidohydrolase/Fe(II)-dependent formamide hydrolase-like protein
MFQGLLRIGFRNIHVVVHHQTENFMAGMPTDLAFKFAARQAIFGFLERERGEGWWGNEKMAGTAIGGRRIRSTGSRPIP